jgi:nuclease-like protein
MHGTYGKFGKRPSADRLSAHTRSVDGGVVTDQERMRLRHAARCRVCGARLPVRTEAWYERSTKAARCLDHDGASESVTPRRVGVRLEELSSERLRVRHDVRIPGFAATIDHLVVTPNGAYVIDAERYAGRPRLAVQGGLLRARVERLMVGKGDCTDLVDSVLEQVKVVRGILGETVPVHGVLCFVGGDWPVLGGALTTRTVSVLWPSKLYPQLRATGPIEIATIDRLHRTLAGELASA